MDTETHTRLNSGGRLVSSTTSRKQQMDSRMGIRIPVLPEINAAWMPALVALPTHLLKQLPGAGYMCKYIAYRHISPPRKAPRAVTIQLKLLVTLGHTETSIILFRVVKT